MLSMLRRYDVIFCDIDDTIVSGTITRLMHTTWKLFKSIFISETLQMLQAYFKLYKPNVKLLYSISNSKVPVVFLTARKESVWTKILLRHICHDFNIAQWTVVELGSYNPTQDKYDYIQRYLDIMGGNCMLIDDNCDLSWKCLRDMRIGAINPDYVTESVME